jgi:hypothetical protein
VPEPLSTRGLAEESERGLAAAAEAGEGVGEREWAEKVASRDGGGLAEASRTDDALEASGGVRSAAGARRASEEAGAARDRGYRDRGGVVGWGRGGVGTYNEQ